MTPEPSEVKFLEEFVANYGCFCGGDGCYTDYNCGAEMKVRCPHCKGTGKKLCKCVELSLKCDNK